MPLIKNMATPAETTVMVTDPKPVYTGRQSSTDTDKMSKSEWAQKDARIGYRGIIQACIESPTAGQYCTGTSKEEFAAHVLALADLINKGCTERGF